jgi:ABC-type uncharacterized transport system involved in gliding motility auxiliary subunit
VSSLLWALGIVGVVFALLNFVVAFAGTGFDPRGLDVLWIGGNLLVGIVLMLAAAFRDLDALRARMRTGEARRAGKYGTSAIAATLLSIAILGMLAFLSTRYHKRFDWSEQQVHSLSSQSLGLLQGLDQDVEVTAFYAALDAGPVRDLLERYAYASPRFQVTYADPNERPDLLERAGISAQDLGEGLVHVTLGGESVQLREVTEEKLTNALVKLVRGGEKTVYFLEGHNERAVDGEAGGTEDAFGRAADALRNENYRVEKLLLASRGEVPEDADVVIAAGPTRPLLEAERAALRRYVDRGGAFFVLLDPRAKTDLVDDVRAWGIDVGDDVVVDRALALFGQATSPFADRYDANHEITREMREPALFHMVRSVRNANGGPFTDLVFTGEASWAERDLERFFGSGEAELDDADLKGPVPVAVAGILPKAAAPETPPPAEGEAEAEPAETPAAAGGGARVAVFGDVDFAANELIEAYRNRDLFVNTVNWLMGDVEAISIRPAVSRASRFQLSQEQFLQIRTLSIFVLPQLLAVLGVIVWWTRRSRPGR